MVAKGNFKIRKVFPDAIIVRTFKVYQSHVLHIYEIQSDFIIVILKSPCGSLSICDFI